MATSVGPSIFSPYEKGTRIRQELLDSDGLLVVTPGAAKPKPTGVNLDTVGMGHISDMVRDPEAPIGDISRLIALEIARIIEQMDSADPLEHHRSMRDLNDQVKALRELQRTLSESDQLSRKDVLNLDGPKFEFVFKTIVDFFRRAMRDAGVDDGLAQSVMLQFGDLVKTNDEHLRRDMNKIEGR